MVSERHCRHQIWGLFLQSSIKCLGPKSKFSNCNLLVLKSWTLNLFFTSEKPRGLKVSWLKASEMRRYKANCGNQNMPEKFRDFWKTGQWPATTEMEESQQRCPHKKQTHSNVHKNVKLVWKCHILLHNWQAINQRSYCVVKWSQQIHLGGQKGKQILH